MSSSECASPYSQSLCHSPLQYHFSRRAAIGEKREHMFLRAMSKAMRYYRIWIYSANVALFLGTLVYTIAFLSVISDERLNFFPNIRLYQPSFIYSYCAILVQGGLLQVRPDQNTHCPSLSDTFSSPLPPTDARLSRCP